MLRAKLITLLLLAAPAGLTAQAHDHAAHQRAAGHPTAAGQAAFATIKEIVAILEADSTTDWTRVDLEALRQHLIMMDRVMMESIVVSRSVPGGIQLDVTGSDPVAKDIAGMLGTHSDVLDREPGLRSTADAIPGGIRLTVTAEGESDQRQVARIRGLGFAGLLAIGDHHTVHHLAIARGEGSGAHKH